MPRSRSVLVRSLAATTALGLSLVTASPAMASGHALLRDGLQGNIPLTERHPTPVFDGVPPAGAPWVLDEDSEVRVREDGRITIELDDLIIEGRGNPARLMLATLLCTGKIAASTPPFPVDREGDGEFEGKIGVPRTCKDPQVLIRNAAGSRPYFAFTSDLGGKHDHR